MLPAFAAQIRGCTVGSVQHVQPHLDRVDVLVEVGLMTAARYGCLSVAHCELEFITGSAAARGGGMRTVALFALCTY